MRHHHRFAAAPGLLMLAVVLVVSACASKPETAPPPPDVTAAATLPVEAPPPVPVVTPAESALAQGVKAYQAAQYTVAETQLKNALQMGLTAPADVASAHKHLAFIYCTSRRESLCGAAFKSARAADPNFALSKSEAGHPTWGPVYRKALAAPKGDAKTKANKAAKSSGKSSSKP